MEKLIEYLVQAAPDFAWHYKDGKIWDIDKFIDKEDWMTIDLDMWVYIISKQFWFIQWLVDNDKIDEDKLENERWNDYDHFNRVETLIQMLSIQDNPIEFLVSVLK